MTAPTFMSAATPGAWPQMSKKALLEVIAEFGAMDIEAADEF